MKQGQNKQVSNGGETSPTEKKEGLTIAEIIPIQNALQALSKKQSALGYQWAKNLSLVTAEMRRASENLKQSRETLLEKDGEGNPINYLAKISGDTMEVMTDKEGNYIAYKEGEKLPEGQTTATWVPKDQLKKWGEIQKDYTEERHLISWHKIPEERIEQVALEEKLEGELLAPLIGTII